MFDPEILTQPGTVLLDTARPDDDNQTSWCFSGPRRVITASALEEVPRLLEALAAATNAGKYIAGYLGYEAGYAFVDLAPDLSDNRPLGWFGVYDEPRRFAAADVEDAFADVSRPAEVRDVELDVSKEDYTDAVEAIREHIRLGDVYQISYTAPLRFQFEGDPRQLYARLRRRQRVPYGAFLNLGERFVLSLSPELFFRRRGAQVVTRPMKGTIRRGRTLEEDRALRKQLASDPKNRAENLMIVDLLRNDLSICCEPGSVQVPALYSTETYETVTQMTSTVEGRLADDAGLADLFEALFPCGSVTGAPKRRAMRLIRHLEPAPRGVYCGAIGMAGPDETATFSVAIRTVVLEGGEGRMGVGSGIVWDSEPEAEYEECRLKGEFLEGHPGDSCRGKGEFELIETMRFDAGEIPLLERHIRRMSESAEYFSFPFDEVRFRDRLETALAEHGSADVLKVRVTLNRKGEVGVRTTPLDDGIEEPWQLAVSGYRVDQSNPFFYHKTTRREVYDRALAAARRAGCDEAVLLNGEGEVTEGTFTNLFVRQGDALYTPPVECGLLGGVYREHVLGHRPEAAELVLSVSDLEDADALYCCNAVRGWCRAKLVPTDPAT